MKNFFKKYAKGESRAFTDQIATKFAETAGPLSDELKNLIKNQDYAALAHFELDYTVFSNAADVFGARSCLALYQKCDDYELGVDRRAVALNKFIESEIQCHLTNLRIGAYRWNDRLISSVLLKAQDIIKSIISDSPPEICDLALAFGPGASSTVKKNTSARWKFSTIPACSADMASTVSNVLATLPHYCDLHQVKPEPRTPFESVFWDYGLEKQKKDLSWTVEVAIEAGKLMFVPKNAKTDRSIIVEPTLNSFLQKGYGTQLKRLLYKSGVNLYDQTLNRSRARICSINGRLMTVDLSSASDTISIKLIEILLPIDWYIALKSARTSHVEYRDPSGQLLTWDLKKFSSMGNGYTFELESLIFYALTKAVCHCVGVRPDVSVYGDDIIAPKEILEPLSTVFDFCGFSINKSKSFSEGPFRESCGADFYTGVNVRPYYNKERWSSATLSAFHNNLVRSGWGLMYPDILEQIISFIMPHHRLFGPDMYGDGHLISEAPPYTRHKADRGWAGYTFRTFVSILNKTSRSYVRGDAVMPHYVAYTRSSAESPTDIYVVRGCRGSKVISVYTLGRF